MGSSAAGALDNRAEDGENQYYEPQTRDGSERLDGSRPYEYAAVCQNPIDVSPDPKRDQFAREAKGTVAL